MKDSFKTTSGFLTASDGVKLRYIKTPRTERENSIVFVHGAGGDATAWKKIQQACFEAGHSSVAIDLRGHGLSDDPIDFGDYAFERSAQDIYELINVLKLNNAIVVGHCFGGMTSIVLVAKNYPSIKGLILIDTSSTPSFFGLSSFFSVKIAKLFRRLAYLFRPGTRQVRPSYDIFIGTKDISIKRLISDIKATSLRSYLFCYGDMFEFDGTLLLKNIMVRTLVVCGERDIIFPVTISRKLASEISGSILKIVPNANHIIVISNPVTLSKIVNDFCLNIVS